LQCNGDAIVTLQAAQQDEAAPAEERDLQRTHYRIAKMHLGQALTKMQLPSDVST
jgi:hypothetical protein